MKLSKSILTNTEVIKALKISKADGTSAYFTIKVKSSVFDMTLTNGVRNRSTGKEEFEKIINGLDDMDVDHVEIQFFSGAAPTAESSVPIVFNGDGSSYTITQKPDRIKTETIRHTDYRPTEIKTDALPRSEILGMIENSVKAAEALADKKLIELDCIHRIEIKDIEIRQLEKELASIKASLHEEKNTSLKYKQFALRYKRDSESLEDANTELQAELDRQASNGARFEKFVEPAIVKFIDGFGDGKPRVKQQLEGTGPIDPYWKKIAEMDCTELREILNEMYKDRAYIKEIHNELFNKSQQADIPGL